MKSTDIDDIYMNISHKINNISLHSSELEPYSNNMQEWINGVSKSVMQDSLRYIINSIDSNVESLMQIKRNLVNLQIKLELKEIKGGTNNG